LKHVQRFFSLRVPRVEQRGTERGTIPHALGLSLGADPPGAQTMPRRGPVPIAELQPRLRRALRYRLSGDHDPPHIGPALNQAVAEFFQGST
jgi:hypothetical protein